MPCQPKQIPVKWLICASFELYASQVGLTFKFYKAKLCEFVSLILFLGIPKHKRGQVWQIFLKQYSLRAQEEADVNSGATQMNCIPSPSPSYEELIRQLTSHQHAILIDLGKWARKLQNYYMVT